MKFGNAQSVPRREDLRFITGAGRYVDDLPAPDALYGIVVRSPHAHARILAIDSEAAMAQPGVQLILTGTDLAAAGVQPLPCLSRIETLDGVPPQSAPRRALALDVVRHVGEPVAFVVADSEAAAVAASEMVVVEYEDLPAVVDMPAALRSSAVAVSDHPSGNVSFRFGFGAPDAVAQQFSRAHHIATLTLVNSRVVVAPMETRIALGRYEAADDQYTLWISGQGVHSLRNQIANDVLNLPPDKVRVIAPDVGGGFGMKNFLYPEYILVLLASRRLGRPVRWHSTRSEAFISDSQGRDNISEVQLALDGDGRFLALQVKTLANMGAYLSSNGPITPTLSNTRVLGGQYAIPAIALDVTGVLTNTIPVDAYRGAGRPEACYAIERIVDVAAREMGIDPIELRRRNLIRPDQMPYRTVAGMFIDCGDFAGNMVIALEKADWGGFEARRQQAQRQGRLLGRGCAAYIEATLGLPSESAEISFTDDGRVTLAVGSQSNGQGHETAFSQLVERLLGIPMDKIDFVQGDTGRVKSGFGHGGSRSLMLAGNAIMRASEAVAEKARRIAAHILESNEADIEFNAGRLSIIGTDRSIGLLELAMQARRASDLPADIEASLDATAVYEREAFNFPNGVHLVEVAVDIDTGQVQIERYVVVDDFGNMVNPLIVAGQVMGGIAQGIGQALLEHTAYDADTGQLLSGSFVDYALPRAGDMPVFDIGFNAVPTATNPLGVKGCGEAGCTGAVPAIMNAVNDALYAAGIRQPVDMPATSERIWRLLNDAGLSG